MEDPEQMQDSYQNFGNRWLRLVKRYQQIPVLGSLNPFFLVAIMLAVILAFLTPRGNCTCEDQFTDEKLEAMARNGNTDVRTYLAQKDNPFNCAGRRLELLKKLQKEKEKSGLPKHN
jgi:hypothetical protein